MRPCNRPADVLVVDDDPAVRLCLARALGREGRSVVTAADGREALEYLAGHAPPRLILLDLVMPVMDGWELLSKLRHHPHLRTVPVVTFSGFADPADPDPLALGAAAALLKPFDLVKVLDAARRTCPAVEPAA
jgi:CheY-like chemotaxis protein